MRNPERTSSVINTEQLYGKSLVNLFRLADEMKKIVIERRDDNRLSGKILAVLSWSEVGIDTELLAFQAAIVRLGGHFILDSIYEGAKDYKDYYHQIASLENLGNTIRLIKSLGVDAIILKHSEAGAAKLAAGFAKIPIINAGGGPNQNPAQVLTNLYAESRGLNEKQEPCDLYIKMALLAAVLGKT